MRFFHHNAPLSCFLAVIPIRQTDLGGSHHVSINSTTVAFPDPILGSVSLLGHRFPYLNSRAKPKSAHLGLTLSKNVTRSPWFYFGGYVTVSRNKKFKHTWQYLFHRLNNKLGSGGISGRDKTWEFFHAPFPHPRRCCFYVLHAEYHDRLCCHTSQSTQSSS